MAIVVEQFDSGARGFVSSYEHVWPGGAPADGELIFYFASVSQSAVEYTPTFPAGFTVLINDTGTFRRIVCAYKIASSETNSYTVTMSTAHNLRLTGWVLSGVDQTTPIVTGQDNIAHSGTGASGISVSFPGSTTSGNLCIAYYHSHNPGSGNAKSWNSGWTNIDTFGVDDPDEVQSARQGGDGTALTAQVTLDTGTCDRQTIAVVEIAAGSSDTTPDQFTFTDQTDVSTNALIPSAAITITGINAATPISISGDGSPEYEINSSGTWTSSPGTVNNNDTVKVRLTSATTGSTPRTATLDAGGVTDGFTATTVGIGIRTDTLYEPNSDSTVANASSVTVRVWNATSISGAPDEVLTNQTVTSGILDCEPAGATNGAAVSYQLKWTTAGGYTRFFETQNQVMVELT